MYVCDKSLEIADTFGAVSGFLRECSPHCLSSERPASGVIRGHACFVEQPSRGPQWCPCSGWASSVLALSASIAVPEPVGAVLLGLEHGTQMEWASPSRAEVLRRVPCVKSLNTTL